MSLHDQVILDTARITSDPNGFNVRVTLTALNGQSAMVYASGNNIGRKIDANNGMIINSKNASVVVHENVILAANPNYPIRNSDWEVAMLGQKVIFSDSSGVQFNYVVMENIPDQTIGLITLMLVDYGND